MVAHPLALPHHIVHPGEFCLHLAAKRYRCGQGLFFAAVHRVGEVLAQVLVLAAHDHPPAMVPLVYALDIAQGIEQGLSFGDGHGAAKETGCYEFASWSRTFYI
jgi:hypothetical protein